ncbi:helix-turn-helix domain-containing protein [Actinoplanes sp. HUAS TT8]|uniref:helix-turn-helix domain-containing protein n=1 Tax=Actinoplanes sp. HUAS TT8 TaxID=3447453 RepID=UPI003F524077
MALFVAAIKEVTIITGQPGPLVSRRQLGVALRQLRVESGLSLGEVAKRLLLSPSKISRIENAQRNISARDVRDLLDLYRVTDPAVRDELMRLVEESRESPWWAQFSLDQGYERLIGLEAAAETISDYQIGAVPGLLQTADYSAAVIGAWIADPEVIRTKVEVRMARQRLIGKSTKLKFVVDESAVRRSVGGRDVMRDQIRKLIEVSAGSHIEFQIIPFSAGAHQGLVGGFIVLQFPNSISAGPAASMSDIVYHEGVVGAGTYVEQFEEVKAYLDAFTELQGKALTPSASISFLETLLRES